MLPSFFVPFETTWPSRWLEIDLHVVEHQIRRQNHGNPEHHATGG